MDLFFSRNDIIQAGVNNRDCLKVLPLGRSKTQKVVIGDVKGVIQSVSYKKGQLVNSFKKDVETGAYHTELSSGYTQGNAASQFKTLPMGAPIDCLVLGQGQGQRDKIFLSHGQTIKGMNKKGKEFFKFRTNLTERMNSLTINDLQVWTAGQYAYNHFVDCKDKNTFLCPDKINAMEVTPLAGDNHQQTAILGNQDHHIRVIQNSKVYYEASVEGPVRTLHVIKPKTVAAVKSHKEVLYSTGTGQMGMMFLDSEAVKRGWKHSSDSTSAVEAMDVSLDLTEDGHRDLVVGRDDGSVEIYAMRANNDEAKLLYKRAVNECVTTITSGFVTDTTLEDIVLSTYSGKVISLSQSNADGEILGQGDEKIPNDKKIRILTQNIEVLQERVRRERERYSMVSDDLIAMNQNQTFHVNDKFMLDSRDATYILTIETPMPIFTVAVQSDVAVDLLETEKNTAILGITPSDPETGNFTAATYRLQESNNRIEVKMRIVEGQSGTIQAFVIPRISPKTCKVCAYRIHPLCLQERVTAPPKDESTRPMNELKITGTFSLEEIHAWVSHCLPSIPSRAPSDDVLYHFHSVLLGTVLSCKYKAGEGIFRSDNVSTLAILKEGMTKEATARKTRVNISFQGNDDTVQHFCRLMHPKLTYQLGLSKKMQLIEALKEVQMQEQDTSFLDPDYVEILTNAETVEKEHKQQPKQLLYLHGIVKDFFIDFHKFKGTNMRQRMPQLELLLNESYTLESLIQFILSPDR